MDTLFGFLATRFSASPENIAIEALGFILSRSGAARAGLRGHFNVCGVQLPDDLRFVTQSTGDDGARPDIEGITGDGIKVCVVECKFWAGLTANQPVAYAERLPDDQPGVLVFIVPSLRLNALWGEIATRLKNANMVLGPRKTHSAETMYAEFGAGHGFVLTSWRDVLGAVTTAMSANNETDGLENAKQLLGLCDRMDESAFLPFRSDEVTSVDIPRRYIQLSQLANDVCDQLVQSDICSNKTLDGGRLTAASSPTLTGRYIRASKTVLLVCFDCGAWSRYMSSPLWLKVDQARYPWARKAFSAYGLANGYENFMVEDGKELAVPLQVVPEVERDRIMDILCRQVTEISEHLAAAEPNKEQDTA